MSNWDREFLESLRKERTTYSEMIEFCADSLILNNDIQRELEQAGFYFETYCGEYSDYYDKDGNEITYEEYEEKCENGEDAEEYSKDIYQTYIIDWQAANRFRDYTNEIVVYCEQLDLYLLCVTHFGTPWHGVDANWKEPKDIEEDEEE